MSKQEILPPLRSAQVTIARPQSAVITVNVPGAHTGGPVASALNKWRYDYTSRAVDSLTKLNHSEAALFNAQTAVVEATIKKRDVLFRLQELPEKLGHELAVRRVERADTYRQAQHRYEMNEAQRRTELTHAEVALTHGKTALTDARQQLKAQEKHGDSTYELAWKKKHLEMLDVELNAAERRVVLRQHRIELEKPSEEDVEERLYRGRAEALADGDDSAIEEEIDEMLARSGRPRR